MKALNNIYMKLLIIMTALWVWGLAHAESFRGSGPLLYQSEGEIGVSAYITISDKTIFGEVPTSIEYEIKNEGSVGYMFRLPSSMPRVQIAHGDIILNSPNEEGVALPIGSPTSPLLSLEQRTKSLAPGESFELSIDVVAEVENLDLTGINEVHLVLVYSIPFARSIADLDAGTLVDRVEIRRFIASLATR